MAWRYQPPEDLSCRDVMDFLVGLGDASVDLIATDPPYFLGDSGFMGMAWDSPRRLGGIAAFNEWVTKWATEAKRILRPGGYLLAMGGASTFDALAWGIRMAGFEIRDSIATPGRDSGVALWVYGSGMSHSKAELKSAFEFVCVARRPFPRTLAKNIAEHGTGGLDIDAGRIPATGKPPGWLKSGTIGSKAAEGFLGSSSFRMSERTPEDVAHVGEAHRTMGRWPPHYALLHDPRCERVGSGGEGVALWRCHPSCPVPKLDAQTGVLKSGKMRGGTTRKASLGKGFQGSATFKHVGLAAKDDTIADSGGPSRFFVLPDPDAKTIEHLPECVLAGVHKLRGDNRGDPGGRRPGGFLQPFEDKGDGKPNARVYPGAEIPIYECAPGCPVLAPLTEAAFDSPEGRDALALEVGFYHKKVYPKDRELPGFQMIVPKDPKKPDKPGVDAQLAQTLCALWGIPIQAGQTALETLTGWPLPMEVWGADEPVLFQPAYSMHPTQKPLALASWLVQIFSPRPDKVGRPVVVVDPFGGSGTFVLAARQLGRVGLYNDFTPKYVAIAAARLEAAGLSQGWEEGPGVTRVGEVGAGAVPPESEATFGADHVGSGEESALPDPVEAVVDRHVEHAAHQDDATAVPRHPASFPPRIIEVLREVVPKGLVLDPFGGIGKLGLLGTEWHVVSLEIEQEWAAQGLGNGCSAVIVGNALRLPFRARSLKCVVTSPSYGNRCADGWAPTDYGTDGARRSHGTRRTYRLALGRDLTSGSGAGLQWGAAYRELHAKALAEIYRVLAPGGTFVLNIKDHVRDKELQGVPAWWVATALTCGFEWVETREVSLKGDQNTARMRKQGLAVVDHEEVVVFRVPAPALLARTPDRGVPAPVPPRRVPFALSPKGGI